MANEMEMAVIISSGYRRSASSSIEFDMPTTMPRGQLNHTVTKSHSSLSPVPSTGKARLHSYEPIFNILSRTAVKKDVVSQNAIVTQTRRFQNTIAKTAFHIITL